MIQLKAIEAILVDLPTIREHRLANQTVTQQTLVIVRLLTKDGCEGIGEATTIGGMSYGPEAPETIKIAIDHYIKPLLLDRPFAGVGAAMAILEAKIRGNTLAKSAIETALTDIVGKQLGVNATALFGGAKTDTLEVAWGLATGDAERDLMEAEEALACSRHRVFKIKVGAGDADDDVARVIAIKHALGDRARVTVDANQAWDELIARRAIQTLQDGGIDLVEQPVARLDTAAMARLTSRFSIPIMADESVCNAVDAFQLASIRACDIFALKIAKSGGLAATAEVAAVARASGIALYGGTMLEGTIGSLASACVFATLAQPIAYGTELFGPLLLKDDIVTEKPKYSDFAIHVPTGHGIGAQIDEDKLDFYRRDSTRTHLSLASNEEAA